MNPGLAYVADTWQVAAEAVVPLNSEGGRRIGMRAHLFLFLDDLIPAVFGKPLFESLTDMRSEQGRADDHAHQCDCELRRRAPAAKHDFEAAFPIEIYAIHEEFIRGGASRSPNRRSRRLVESPAVSSQLRRPISSLEEAALSNGLSMFRYGS